MLESQEAELLVLAKCGNAHAFEEVLTPHLPMLFAYSRAICGDYHVAQDVVQETALIAYRKLNHLFPEVVAGGEPLTPRPLAPHFYAPRFSLKGHSISAVSPSGDTLAMWGNKQNVVALCDVESGTSRALLSGHSATVTAAVFASDGRTLATGSADGVIKRWNVASGDLQQVLRASDGGISALAFLADGQTLIARAGDAGAVTVWDLATGLPGRTAGSHPGSVFAFSTDGRLLASATDDGAKVLISNLNGERQAELLLPAEERPAQCAAFSPDGKTLAVKGPVNVTLWDVDSGVCRDTLIKGGAKILCMCFSPDGRFLATGHYASAVTVRDVSARKKIGIFYGPTPKVNSVAFGPDGRTVLVGSGPSGGGTVALWDLP